MSDFETQTGFTLTKGIRDTDRLITGCFMEIAKLLDGKAIYFGDRACAVACLKSHEKGKPYLMFDIRNPDDTYDHIEFTITKTGWGRKS